MTEITKISLFTYCCQTINNLFCKQQQDQPPADPVPEAADPLGALPPGWGKFSVLNSMFLQTSDAYRKDF